jgi:multimeric flavodoxin WrbA
MDADGLVMGSPNYFRSITAQLKTMIDRIPCLFRKHQKSGLKRTGETILINALKTEK